MGLTTWNHYCFEQKHWSQMCVKRYLERAEHFFCCAGGLGLEQYYGWMLANWAASGTSIRLLGQMQALVYCRSLDGARRGWSNNNTHHWQRLRGPRGIRACLHHEGCIQQAGGHLQLGMGEIAGTVAKMSPTRQNVAYFCPYRPIWWLSVSAHFCVSFSNIDGPRTKDIGRKVCRQERTTYSYIDCI